MELHSVQNAFHRGHQGEERQEMLSLNRRLETYLNRVKLLEEDNVLLAKEIWSLKHSEHRALTRRKGLEDELQQARLDVDAAWRDRVHTELEVGRLAEELQALNLQRQKEAQAQVKAKTMLERSRKELEEEQRAQVWLREKVSQLEHEMRLLVENHQDDVAHLEALPTRRPTLAQRGNPTPNLLQLGQEFSHRATRAWQEAAEAYQGQLARLEESLSQARSRLSQVAQEKSEIQLKLQTLQKEVISAQDVRLHLEESAARQRARHSQEVQELQEHLEGLEDEKEQLGRQINGLLLQNRGLLQLKVSLGLEVAAYRALLDGESLTGEIAFSNAGAALCPQGMKQNRQTSVRWSVYGATGTGLTATPAYATKPVAVNQTPEALKKKTDAAQSPMRGSPYPKILQDGAVENFRPQEVCEKVTRAEPLSPAHEDEAFALTTARDKKGEEKFTSAAEAPEEALAVDAPVSCQVEAGYSSEPRFNDDSSHQLFADLTPELFRTTERPRGQSSESDNDVSFEGLAEKEELQEQPRAPVDAQDKVESISEDVEHVQEDTSLSETEALLEPTSASRTSSPVSEESVFNQPTDVSLDESIANDDTVEKSRETTSQVGTNETDVEDKLYPDGEEMDTWDSVIERKVDVKTNDCITKGEEPRQHAEPEEDISAKEPEQAHGGVGQAVVTCVEENDVASAATDTQDDDMQHVALDQEDALLSDREDDDSQNVSVSWRTEVEGDSYAQENTIADTRPLIHYKSDETDANTHVDESEFSESEQEKKLGEIEMWSEGKSKKFGTMDDLCEEAEGEILEEEYNLEYTRTDDRNGGHGPTAGERVAAVKDTGNTEETMVRVYDGHSDKEAAEPLAPTDVDFGEGLDMDRLVEQELENLCTDRYSARVAQRQHSGSERTSVEKVAPQQETGQMEPEAMFSWENPELSPSTASMHGSHENLYFGDSPVTAAQMESHKCKDGTTAGTPGKREEDDVTHSGEREGDFKDFLSRPETEDTRNPKDSDPEQEEDIQQASADTSIESQEHLVEDLADCRSFPDTAEASEWERRSEEAEIRGEAEHGQTCDDVPESDKGHHHDDKGSEEGIMTLREEPTEVSPDSGPDEESQIYVLKDPNEPDPYDVFSSAVKSDFWVSCAESNATWQPGDTFNEAAEPTNQNLGFGENLVWEDVEKTNVLNGNSKVDSESGKALDDEAEQTHLEVKQASRRNVAGESVHSEESEAEGESWSSGEEPI